uniref:F-box/kelch-repeat protein n=1 Tax=Noccaea caerulescens TaxID=107243 RepID=A0A1J3D066_NOCCA
MGEAEKNPNPIYIIPDLLEEIFLALPLKSIFKFKTVSKQWRSILESRMFAERRLKLQNQLKPKILAVGDHRSEPRFRGDSEEIEMVYLNCDDAATRPSLTCDGLVCIPVPGWVTVLNPSSGELIRFPSGPDPVTRRYSNLIFHKTWWNIFPAYWAMGFGRDIVNGSYKVVRMFFEPSFLCEILDVEIGEWRKVNPPPYRVEPRRKSAFVKGSVFWLEMRASHNLLALDLHTEEFRDVTIPPVLLGANQLVNFEDRLAIAAPYTEPEWKVEIWILDEQEETWSMAYSIGLANCGVASRLPWNVWFRPVAVSNQGNIFFHDNEKRMFKYHPETDVVRCIAREICVVSDFVENVVSLRPSIGSKTSEYRSGFHYQDLVHNQDHISKIDQKFSWIKLPLPNILLTTGLVSLFIFRYFAVSSRS